MIRLRITRFNILYIVIFVVVFCYIRYEFTAKTDYFQVPKEWTNSNQSLNPMIIKGVYKAFDSSNQFHYDKDKQRNYTALSVSIPNYLNDVIFYDENGRADKTPAAWSYLFLLPLTALSWQRLHRTNLVIVTLDLQNIQPGAKELFLHVKNTLMKMGVRILIFNVPSNLMVRLAQLLRLIPATFNLFNDNDYIISSDADLWPLNSLGLYDVAGDKKLKIYNAKCCGTFLHDGITQPMYPLSHFDIPGNIWKEIYEDDVMLSPNDINEIRDIFNTDQYDLIRPIEFEKLQNFMKSLEKYAAGLENYVPGDIYKKSVHAGPLWFFDQNYASTKMYHYIQKYGNKSIDFHEPSCVRVETWTWEATLRNFTHLSCLYDTQVFKKEKPFEKDIWKRLIQLPKILYDNVTIAFLEDYREKFMKIYESGQGWFL